METELKEPNHTTHTGQLPGPGRDVSGDAHPIQQVQIEPTDDDEDIQDVDYIEEDVQSRVPKPLVSLKPEATFIL